MRKVRNMKQLSSFMVLEVNGGDRISFTYDVIDDEGNLTDSNQKESFFVINDDVKSHIESIRNYIRKNKFKDN